MTPTISISTPWSSVTITVEVAATRPVMGKEAVWSFYMRNTFIPLDMIFIRRDLTVAGVIANATPCTETRRSIHKPSSYVLEVNGGWAAAHQIAAGAKARFDSLREGKR